MLHDIIIIEGVKKVGKTSLANDILKKFPYANYYKEEQAINIQSGNKPISYFIKGSLLTILDLLEKQMIKTPVLFDRGHISEYGFSYYRENLNVEYLFDIDNRLSKLNAKIIYLNDEYTNIKTRTDLDCFVAYNRMHWFINQSKCDIIEYNYEEGYSSTIENFIKKGNDY